MISYDRAHEVFRYDPKTGGVFWRVSLGRSKAGEPVGKALGNHGYRQVQVDGCKMLLHRLAFFVFYGWVPEEVDHENRIKTDNRIMNLRPATTHQNRGNVAVAPKNSSGFKGVCYRARSRSWHAQLWVNGRSRHLGACATPEEASRLYDKAAREYFGEFAWLNHA